MRKNCQKIARITSIAALSLLTACSLDTGARIRVAMPTQENLNLMTMAASSSSWMESRPAAPSSFSGFHCFGLNVTGDGVPRSRVCANDPSAGALGGLAPFSGGIVDVRVPPGGARKIQLLGAMTDDASCPWLAGMSPNDHSGPGVGVYLLGETTEDIFEDKRISIQAQYTDAAAAIPMLENCGDEHDELGDMTIPWNFPGLGLWLKSTENAVISTGVGSWSGPGTSLTQATAGYQPILTPGDFGSKPGISFVTNDWMSLDGGAVTALNAPTSITSFAVIRVPNTPIVGQIYKLAWTGTNTHTLTLSLDGSNQLTAASMIYPSYSATETTSPLAVDTPTLVEVEWIPGSLQDIKIWVNGTLTDATGATTGATILDNHATVQLGASGGGGKVSWAELITYNTAFSAGDRNQMHCYFQAKYGITVLGAVCP